MAVSGDPAMGAATTDTITGSRSMKGVAVSEVLQADLDAIRGLADRLRSSATDLRGLDAREPFSSANDGLAGSDSAAASSTAVERISAVLKEWDGPLPATTY